MSADIAEAPPLVHLDELGHPRADDTRLRLAAHGVLPSVAERLERVGAELVGDDADIDATLISTRLPPDELRELAERLGGHVGRTIVLAHTGAERLAADLVRAGADAVVGEGNEEALLGLVDAQRSPTALLSSFERRYGGQSDTGHRGRDQATGLPDRRSFEQRIASLADADETPRIAYAKVVADDWRTHSPTAAVMVQRRRLATSLAHVAHAAGVELYTTGIDEFGVVSETLSPHDTERLARRLVAAAGTFRDRGLALRLVIGHAGPESAHDAEAILDLARRAVEVAATDGATPVLGAEELVLGVSVTTELEAVVRLLEEVEPTVPEGRGHGERVGRISAELARLRGFSPTATSRAHLAGHLHDVGRAGLPAGAVESDELSGELLEAWRSFPVRSAERLQLTAGKVVAEAVRAQRERWDGNGFPDGVADDQIPDAARVLAVAHAVDEIVVARRTTAVATIADELDARAGGELDPDIVDTAVQHLGGLLAARG